MNRGGAALSPQQQLAERFARRLVHWATERDPTFSGAEVLEQAARRVSLATAEGHVCTDLRGLSRQIPTGTPAEVEQLLLQSGVVARAGDRERRPLVLDADGRLYLYRYFDYERRLAEALRALANDRSVCPDPAPGVAALLNELFGPGGPGADWQKLAAALALLGRLTIISGGPGTGKTTTVVNVLACLIAAEPDCRIALAAPTGKAAARVLAALRERAAHLPVGIRDRLPQTSFTIHRLLGVLPRGGFRHHADNPLAFDVLVVDEASMLDLALAVRLIEAIPPAGRLILLGDKDQLAAVEAGAVFAEIAADPGLSPAMTKRLAALTATDEDCIVTPEGSQASPLTDSVVWFRRNYRFRQDSGIGRLAGLVNSGDTAGARAWLEQGGDASVRWWDDRDVTLGGRSLSMLLAGYRDFLAAMRTDVPQPPIVFEAFNRFRVLCAIRESARGVASLNRYLTSEFRRCLSHRFDVHERADWFPGRPVMILRNDYALRLFNGDIGITLPDAAGALQVHFPDADGTFRAIPSVRLPDHETAFAMTVHKSQGSEFESIALVLPGKPLPVVTRELLYTGLTRAKTEAALVTGMDVLLAGIANPTGRHSGLIAQLKQPLRGAEPRLRPGGIADEDA